MTCDNTIYTPPKKKGGDENLAKLIDRSIESIVVPDGVTEIGEFAFCGCSSLESVELPSTLTIIRTNAFSRAGIKAIEIPNGVTEIGGYAFDNCVSLEAATIPGSVATWGTSPFGNCTKLKQLVLGEGLKTIGSTSFRNSALQSITIPSTVTDLKSAFSECKQLQTIVCKPVNPPTGNSYIFNLVPNDCAIYVPSQSVSAYKTAQYWSARADHIQAIQE